MATRFTRVTVVGDGSQLDVSLPSEDALSLHLPTVLELLSVPVTQQPGRWRLAHPSTGALAPNRSLADSGILDGSRLHLVTADEAPPAPFVDDVEDTVATLVEDTAPAWSGPGRHRALGWLLLPVLLALLLSTLSPGLQILGPVAALLVALVAGVVLPGPGGTAAAIVAVPAAALLLSGIGTATGTDLGAPLLLSTVVGIGGLLAALSRRHLTSVLAATVFTATSLLALGGWSLDLPADRLAGIGLVLAVVLAGTAGPLALGGAGLVDLMVADEQGHRSPRTQVVLATGIGRTIASGLSWGSTTVAAPSLLVLAFSPGWVPPSLAGLGCLILLLRSRLFTRVSEVLPQLLAAVIGLVGLALHLPGRGLPAPVVLVALLLLAGAVLVTGLVSLREVTGARLSRVFDKVEFLAVLLLIPAVVLLFDVFATVRSWVS